MMAGKKIFSELRGKNYKLFPSQLNVARKENKTTMQNVKIALKGSTLLTTHPPLFADQQTTAQGFTPCCASHLFLHAV